MKNKFAVDTKPICRIRMQGARIPSFCIALTGWRHNRKRLIQTDGMIIKSPWLSKRVCYFNSYTAAVYKETAKALKEHYIQREKWNDRLKIIQRNLAGWERELSVCETETIRGKRKFAEVTQCISQAETEQAEMSVNLKAVKITIDECEHAVEQLLQDKRQRVESQMLMYLQGAKITGYGKTLLGINEHSRELYHKLSQEFCYCTVSGNLKEGE